MKYYRYLITSIMSFFLTIEVLKNANRIDNLGSGIITVLFACIFTFAIAVIFLNIYKFIKVRLSLRDEKAVRWSFNNEDWRKYIKSETKERLKHIGHGLKYIYILNILYFISPILSGVEGNVVKDILNDFIVITSLETIVIVFYNFMKTMFFYCININSNGEIIMREKIILINGELNNPDNFLRRSKTTVVGTQYSIYYDDSIELNILKIESGEVERKYSKGNTLKVIKTIRVPISDDCNVGVIKRNFKIKVNQSKQRSRLYSK